MMSLGDPITADRKPLVAFVWLRRCVVRRSVDGEPLRVAIGEYATRHRAVLAVIILTQWKLH